MRRIATSSRVVDKFGTGKDGFTNTTPTTLDEDWFNDAQESFARAGEDAGMPVVTDGALDAVTQLSQVIQAAAARPVVANMTLASEGAANWLDVIYDDATGQYITVGSGPDIRTSPQGTAWTQRSTSGSEDLNSLASNEDNGSPLIIAVGDQGDAYTTADGVTWTLRDVGVNVDLYGVAWNGSLFCAAGDATNHYTTTDGITWTARTKAEVSVIYKDIAWGAGLFVAVGGGGGIETSPDGITWTARTSNTASDLESVDYAPNGRGEGLGLFVAVGSSGGLVTSPDGITWTAITSWQGALAGCTVVRHLGDRVGWLIGGSAGQLYHGHPHAMVDNNADSAHGGNAVRGFAAPAKGSLNRYGRIVMAQDSTTLAYSQRI